MSVSESNNNIRLRTTPLGSDKYLKLNINQNFDFLEILSLKISQEELYKRYCSDYGVIVGRVVCNDGVGVPNAKLSVFIPISEEDQEKPVVRSLYPFNTVNDVDSNNIRYNLLFETPRQDDICHRAVGSFPEKRRIIDCDPWCEVYGKYYKFTTSTNASGDYMIFGVPTGTQIIHVDVDLSDIGYLSQKPYDLIGQGSPETLFDSYNQFKTSTNIGQLPQVKTQNKTINVIPLWGDTEQCEIGINRVDFDLNYKIIPSAFFIGSIFTDTAKNSINKRCRPKRNVGANSQLGTGEGTIQMIRKTPNGGTEVFDIDGGRVIDENGVWITQIPMNLEHKITDEFGDLVDSGNPNVGIATKGKYRFKIGLNEGGALGRLRSTAKFLVPNYGDYSFDDTTPLTYPLNGKTYPNFAEMEWNGVYTVKQFISRFQKNARIQNKNFIGIKNTADSGSINPFPWNSMSQDVSFLFLILCIILNVISLILIGINGIISTINTLINGINAVSNFVGLGDVADEIDCITISVETNPTPYCPGCFNSNDQGCDDDLDSYFDSIVAALADGFNVFKFDFIHDWINGTLYAFPFKVKRKINKSKPKFCDVDELTGGGNDFLVTYQCAGSGSGTGIAGGYKSDTVHYVDRGLIKYLDGEYFYAPRESIGSDRLYPTSIYNLGSMKTCDVLGKPKIVTNIPSTTFNQPDEVFSPDPGDIAIEPFLTGINCFGLNIDDATQCLNHRLFCELGVDYDSDNGAHSILNDGDISDIPYFDTAKIRGDLECLNVPLICPNNCTTPPSGWFTLGDWSQYRTGDLNFLGTTSLDPYSPFIVDNFYRSDAIQNSFYFYFGIIPGKTAIDRLISQYFAPCERSEPCIILISGTVKNNVCISGNSGSISVNPKYGTPPYKYEWYSDIYVFGSTSNVQLNASGQTINNLFSGLYTVLVRDSVGNVCKKTFTVLDPSKFIVGVDYSPYICQGTNNGYISVTVDGGNPPYTIVWLSGGTSINAFNSANTINSFYLTGLGPTSNCTNSGVTFFSPSSAITGNISTNSNTNTTTNGIGTNIFSFTVGNGSWVNASSGNPPSGYYNYIANTNLIYTLNLNLTFNTWSPSSDFTIEIGGVSIYDHTISYNNVGTFSLNLTIPFNQTFNDSLLDFFVSFNNTSFTVNNGYWSAYDVSTNSYLWQIGISPTGILSASLPSFYYLGFTGYQSIIFNPTIGSGYTGTASTINNGGVIGGGGQFYTAIVYDSSGQYGCLNISGLTVDITQSCGFTVTATSVGNYCTGQTNSGRVTWGPIGGGVPPFTYILESNSFYWSGTSSSYNITKGSLSGTPCPGLTYTATCIDSCGFKSYTTVSVGKSNLRTIGRIILKDNCELSSGGDFYRYYVYIFAGGGSNFIFTDGCGGSASGFYGSYLGSSNAVDVSGTYWRYIPPLPPGISTAYIKYGGGTEGLCALNGYTSEWSFTRTSYNSTLDIININLGAPSGLIVPELVNIYVTGPLLICKNESFLVHSVLTLQGNVGSNLCNFSVKSIYCPETITILGP